MLPLAPALVFHHHGLAECLGQRLADGRAMMSDEPPGGYGTTMRMGLAGQDCARAPVAATMPNATEDARTLRRLSVMFVSP
jgi:hypothetical protein